jgi:hypothetical protein
MLLHNSKVINDSDKIRAHRARRGARFREAQADRLLNGRLGGKPAFPDCKIPLQRRQRVCVVRYMLLASRRGSRKSFYNRPSRLGVVQACKLLLLERAIRKVWDEKKCILICELSRPVHGKKKTTRNCQQSCVTNGEQSAPGAERE